MEEFGQDRLDTVFKLNVKGTTNFAAFLSLIGCITSEAGPDTGQHLLCAWTDEMLHRFCESNSMYAQKNSVLG